MQLSFICSIMAIQLLTLGAAIILVPARSSGLFPKSVVIRSGSHFEFFDYLHLG